MALAPRKVVVDDSDANLTYTGGWIQEQRGSYDHYGNFGPTYLSTTHSTSSGGILTFPFNGTSIQVYGTTAVSGTPTWDCYVDGIKFASEAVFTTTENNWSLCELDVIADGQHELTVNVTSTNATFAFDWLSYTPSPNASLASAVVQIDHTDPALNFSSTGWSELNGRASTNVTGSQVQFDFIGSSLSWVGYIPVELSQAAANGTYTIDGGSPISFELTGLNSSATSSVYYQTFFTTQDLAQGPHTIMITHNGGSDQTPLTMDYLLVTNSSSASSETISPTPQVTAVAAGSSVHIGAIVGIIAGAVLLIAAIVAFLLIRRCKRSQRNDGSHPYDLSEPDTFDPFHHSTTTSLAEPYIPPPSPMPDVSTSEVDLGYITTETLFTPGYSMAMTKQEEAGFYNLPEDVWVHRVTKLEEVPPNYSPT
ncbi:hypothetical protein C0991_011301 [Blastosporella zonata]|nr:hypothetical protein C0991_011301 [Blastosporella zonata]